MTDPREDTTVGSLTNEQHDALASFGIINPRPLKKTDDGSADQPGGGKVQGQDER